MSRELTDVRNELKHHKDKEEMQLGRMKTLTVRIVA